MRPCMDAPFLVRGRQFGGSEPLLCVPLVARNGSELAEMARRARDAGPDLVEWRADGFEDLSPESVRAAVETLRSVFENDPIIFTLRHSAEGGLRDLAQEARQSVIEAVLNTGLIDIIDIELRNESHWLDPVMAKARAQNVRVILSFHDFNATPATDVLRGTILAMSRRGADVAKIAVMPVQPEDVLRLLQITLEARRRFPSLSLSTMSMGRMGSVSRVTGFLYGSDLVYASCGVASAAGQIPLADARSITNWMLAYC